jgi:hypothetical protein
LELMSPIKDYITERIRKLEDSLSLLRSEVAEREGKIREIERELLDLRNAARAIGVVNGLRKQSLGVTRRKSQQTTIKEAVLAVLADHPEGLIALDLLARINARYGWTLVRPSLSPQLTRLKRDHKVVYLDGIWRLPNDPDLFLHTDTKTK